MPREKGMPDFIYARGTFYPITATGEREYFCDTDEETLSFLVADHPNTVEVDGVTIAHQAGDAFTRERFREWEKSEG
jgi:hypothetical protein